MADDRRKFTDSNIIADRKLLTVAEATSRLPTKGSRHFAATVMQCAQNGGSEYAVDVSESGDRGLFLLH